MKFSGETKLLLALALFAALGAGFLVLTSRPPAPPAPERDVTQAAFDAVLKNAAHTRGPADAPAVLVEFADFECPACRRAHATVLKELGKGAPVRFVYRHFPFEGQHPMALPAAVASEAAARQGKFWEMYDALFDWERTKLDEAFIERAARKVGLDMARFRKDREDPTLAAAVRADQRLGTEQGVDQTPTFFLRDAEGKVSQVVGRDALSRLLAEKKLLPPGASGSGPEAPPGPP